MNKILENKMIFNIIRPCPVPLSMPFIQTIPFLRPVPVPFALPYPGLVLNSHSSSSLLCFNRFGFFFNRFLSRK